MNLTIIARADNTGLGVQSRNWVRMMKPHKVVVIDSSSFNDNKQHFDWYDDQNTIRIDGFIQRRDFNRVLAETDVLLTFEIPYNYDLLVEARSRGIKTVIQNNWEFTDYLKHPKLPLPDLLLNHSYWNIDKQKRLWPDITDYCPSPLFMDDFSFNRNINMIREGTKRFVHVAGRKTYLDRNGTDDLLKAVKLIPADIPFTLVIKTQTAPVNMIDDPRVIIDTSIVVDEKELYYDFDAMILPRRYAGACLPMNEALASGLPVIMPNIDPNDKVLPSYWLINATHTETFMARTDIPVYTVDYVDLAAKITHFALMDHAFLRGMKTEAQLIAKREYDFGVVWTKWDRLMYKLGVQ